MRKAELFLKNTAPQQKKVLAVPKSRRRFLFLRHFRLEFFMEFSEDKAEGKGKNRGENNLGRNLRIEKRNEIFVSI